MQGRNVMMGYLNQPEKTDEAITKSGWLRSGDLGTVDDAGFFKITGRAKEILITAGMYIYYVPPTNAIFTNAVLANAVGHFASIRLHKWRKLLQLNIFLLR